jgi:putative ABC transport system ATP-binding protein/lipoprotein-releasing system ATP-binding protein
MEPLVACIEAGRSHGATEALLPVTCTVGLGDRIAIMGPSGSGKSTLLYLMAGLDLPTHGTVTWPAFPADGLMRRGPIAMIFQGASLLLPLSVVENVALPLLLEGRNEKDALARAHESLGLLDIDALAPKLPEELSGGQAQRVAIARALTTGSLLVLADEPTSQLDTATAAHVVDVLLDAADATGAALVVATHDAEIAARLEQCWSISDGLLMSEPSAA